MIPTSDAIREVIATTCHVSMKEAHDQARLVEDLRLDSLEMVYLLMAIDDAFDTRMEASNVVSLVTAGDLIAEVRRVMHEPLVS